MEKSAKKEEMTVHSLTIERRERRRRKVKPVRTESARRRTRNLFIFCQVISSCILMEIRYDLFLFFVVAFVYFSFQCIS